MIWLACEVILVKKRSIIVRLVHKQIACQESRLRTQSTISTPTWLSHVDVYGLLQLTSFNVEGDFLYIIGQDPSVSKSNQLQIDIFQFFSV